MASKVPVVQPDLGGADERPAKRSFVNRGACPIVIGGRSIAPGETFDAEPDPELRAFLVRAGFLEG